MNLDQHTPEQARDAGIAAGCADGRPVNPYADGTENALIFDEQAHLSARAIGVGMRRVLISGAGIIYFLSIDKRIAQMLLGTAINEGLVHLILTRVGVLMSYRGEIPNWPDQNWKELKAVMVAGLRKEPFPESFDSPIEKHPITRLVYDVCLDFVKELNGGRVIDIDGPDGSVEATVTFDSCLLWLRDLPPDDFGQPTLG